MRKLLILFVGCAALVAGVSTLARSYPLPFASQLHERRSVASVQEALGPAVKARLRPALQAAGLKQLPKRLILAAFKRERRLDVIAKTADGLKFIKSYPFTAFSGQLGPKLRQGDRQIPEGIYKISYLNPNSSYYLSMKLSYPNALDKKMSKLSSRAAMGGDIFIHGKAVTIGCIPIGDEAIEELFLMVAAAKRPVKVIIAPWDFREDPSFPEIAAIDWETALYRPVQRALARLPRGR